MSFVQKSDVALKKTSLMNMKDPGTVRQPISCEQHQRFVDIISDSLIIQFGRKSETRLREKEKWKIIRLLPRVESFVHGERSGPSALTLWHSTLERHILKHTDSRFITSLLSDQTGFAQANTTDIFTRKSTNLVSFFSIQILCSSSLLRHSTQTWEMLYRSRFNITNITLLIFISFILI